MNRSGFINLAKTRNSNLDDAVAYKKGIVVSVLTDSANPTKIRKRATERGSYIGTNCPQAGKDGDELELLTVCRQLKMEPRISEAIL